MFRHHLTAKCSREFNLQAIRTECPHYDNPELGVEYVARLFAQMKIRLTPVIKGGLLGVISISDILRKSDFFEKPKSQFEMYCVESSKSLEARIYED